MRTRLLTRFAVKALVVAVAAGGGLLTSGVADAAPLPIDPAALCALNIGNPAAASATTTTLATAPTSGLSQGLPVVLIAIVTPCAAKGTVQFQDGGTDIGDPVTVISGLAFTIAPTLTAGTHSLIAKFTPTDSPFDSSASAPLSLTVSPPIIANMPPLLQLFLNGDLLDDPARLLQFLHGGHPAAPTGLDLAALFQLLGAGPRN